MFCVKCGKEIPNDSKVCMYCGTKIKGSNTVEMQTVYTIEKRPKKKKRKLVLVIAIVIVLIFVGSAILSDGSEESTADGYIYDETQEPVSLEEAGGFEAWKASGYEQVVRTDICVQLPVETRENNNYAVTVGALGTDIVVIMQEDESPVKEWEWLMNAKPYEEDGDRAFFTVTLSYIGQDTEEGYPVLIVHDIEAY